MKSETLNYVKVALALLVFAALFVIVMNNYFVPSYMQLFNNK